MGRRKNNAEAEHHAPPPAAGHNQLSDDQLHALTAQHAKKYETALATKKAADKLLKDVCKAAHADLGDTAVDDIKDMLAASSPEGEKILLARLKAQEERQARMARWLGLAPGAQPSMFENDRTPAVDRAFADGKRVGLAGGNCAPPHAPDTEQAAKWLEGFHDGQAVLSKGFKPLSTADKGEAHIAAVSEKLGTAPATYTQQ